MLIVFSGMPGTGKTTIAKKLALRLAAVYLRIDTLEQALIKSGIGYADIGSSGYFAAYAVARDNLLLGLSVIADSVNPITITRNAWRNCAFETGIEVVEIELICSDTTEHRRRIESRTADIPGHLLPDWKSVIEREYDSWNCDHIVIDTAKVSADHAVDAIIRNLPVRLYSGKKTVIPKACA
jgi:predicted kinase